MVESSEFSLLVPLGSLQNSSACIHTFTTIFVQLSVVDLPYSATSAVCILQTPVTGWLEAFAAHPRIGDMEELRARFSASAAMSREEQATAAAETDDEVLRVCALK